MRGARLRAGKSYLERAIQHLCPMELSCNVREAPPNQLVQLNPRARDFTRRRSAVVAAQRIRKIAENESEWTVPVVQKGLWTVRTVKRVICMRDLLLPLFKLWMCDYIYSTCVYQIGGECRNEKRDNCVTWMVMSYGPVLKTSLVRTRREVAREKTAIV